MSSQSSIGPDSQHAQHTAYSSSEPVVAHWLEGGDNGNNETPIEVPPPLDTNSPWYRGKDLHPHCFNLRFLAACLCVSAVCRHVTHSSSAFACLSPYKKRKLKLQHRHTILVVRNQEIMTDLWKKTGHRFPAAHVLLWPLNKVACISFECCVAGCQVACRSAVPEKTLGTGWSDKVAVSVCLCF